MERFVTCVRPPCQMKLEPALFCRFVGFLEFADLFSRLPNRLNLITN